MKMKAAELCGGIHGQIRRREIGGVKMAVFHSSGTGSKYVELPYEVSRGYEG